MKNVTVDQNFHVNLFAQHLGVCAGLSGERERTLAVFVQINEGQGCKKGVVQPKALDVHVFVAQHRFQVAAVHIVSGFAQKRRFPAQM